MGLGEEVTAVQGAAAALEVKRKILKVLIFVVHVRRERAGLVGAVVSEDVCQWL